MKARYLDLARVVTFMGAASLYIVVSSASAQSRYPERPVKVVVAFAPGGNNDVPVRIVTTKLAEIWNVGVIVENRAGAGGIIGTDFVAKASPDGYTLINCNSATHGVNPALHKKLPYDAVRNFTAISLIGTAPNVVLVTPNSSIRSVQELIAYAKSNPGRMAVGTAGIGSTQHFSLEMLKSMTGTDMIHVPFKGGSLALSDLMAGQVPAAITGLPTALTAIKAGKVRALAVTSLQRSRLLPELPTVAESGVPGYEVTTWTGLCAPSGTPQSVIDRVHADVDNALKAPEIRQRLLDAGVEPNLMGPGQLGALISQEVTRFSKIAASAGIQPE